MDQEIVNWVTTADGCVHTADADATKQFRRVGGVYWALRTDENCTYFVFSISRSNRLIVLPSVTLTPKRGPCKLTPACCL